MKRLSPSATLALAVLRGEASYPEPKQATRTKRFMLRKAEPRELAVRSKTGSPIGPRR